MVAGTDQLQEQHPVAHKNHVWVDCNGLGTMAATVISEFRGLMSQNTWGERF